MQEGGLLERPAVNLQTATQSGIGTGQEARILLHDFTWSPRFPSAAVSYGPSLLPNPSFFSNNPDFPIVNSASTQTGEERT